MRAGLPINIFVWQGLTQYPPGRFQTYGLWSTATIKFSRQEIEQLIKSIVLRLKVGDSLGIDEEKESYNTLKKDLIEIKQQLTNGEQKTNNQITKEEFYGDVCETCE